MAAFLSEEAKSALTGAIKAVEARSSAELVIAVRAQSGSYLVADLSAAILTALAVLAALLYLPKGFDLYFFLVDPVVFGLLAGLACSRLPGLRRWLSPPKLRRAQVREAARATFYEKGVRRTSEAVGILVYVSLLERRAEVVADHGVLAAVDGRAWDEAVERIGARVRAGEDGVAVAQAIEALGDLLEPCLPRAEDDVNELADEVHE